MRITLWFLLLAGWLNATRPMAQSPGTLDTNYVTLAGTDSTPSFVVALAGGKVLTGGSFTNYGGSGRAGLVRLNADGTVDTSFTMPAPRAISPPVIFNGTVVFAGATNAGTIVAAVVRPDGRMVVQGPFTHLGTEPMPAKVALLNPDGTLAPFAPDLALPGRAALLNTAGDSVYFASSFNPKSEVRKRSFCSKPSGQNGLDEKRPGFRR